MKAENSLSYPSFSGRILLDDTLPVLDSSFKSLRVSRKLDKSDLTEENSQLIDGRWKNKSQNEQIVPLSEFQIAKKLNEILKSTMNIIIEEAEGEDDRHELFLQGASQLSELFEEHKEEDWRSSLSAEPTDEISNRSTFKSEPFEDRAYLTAFESGLAESLIKKESAASQNELNNLLDDLSSFSEAHLQLLLKQNKQRNSDVTKTWPGQVSEFDICLLNNQLNALKSFQRHVRSLLLRRKFFRFLRMNEEFEQKKQYIKLKRSIKMYETARDTEFWSRYSMIISQLESGTALEKLTL